MFLEWRGVQIQEGLLGMRILDLSAGNRAIWFDPDYRDAVFVDIRPDVKPDIVCDTRALPAEIGEGYALVVFDPPHKNSAASGVMSKRNYGHFDLKHIRDTLERTAAEAHRVTAQNALMAFKWNDHSLRLSTALELMADHWEPLFGHGVKAQQRKRDTMTSWALLRRRHG